MTTLTNLAIQSGLKKDHASDREYILDFDWRGFGDKVVFECVKIALFHGDHNTARHIREHFQL